MEKNLEMKNSYENDIDDLIKAISAGRVNSVKIAGTQGVTEIVREHLKDEPSEDLKFTLLEAIDRGDIISISYEDGSYRDVPEQTQESIAA